MLSACLHGRDSSLTSGGPSSKVRKNLCFRFGSEADATIGLQSARNSSLHEWRLNMSINGRLKNIANGLCGSFVSRNNDVNGYWSIGKLRLLAEQHGQATLSLDPLSLSMQPASSEFSAVLARYRRLLEKLAKLSRVPLEEIKGAYITIDFAPEPWPRPSYIGPRWGDQFVLTVTITANGRATGIVRHASYCRPHDPTKESKSTRCSNN